MKSPGYVYRVRAWHDSWRSFSVQLEKKAAAGVDLRLEMEEGRRLLQELLERARAQEVDEAGVIEAALQILGPPATDGQAARQLRPRPGGGRATPPLLQDISVFPATDPGQLRALLDDALAAAINRVGPPAFETITPAQYPLSVESGAAVFSSWYELFPRSQSAETARHGSLRRLAA